MSKKDKDKKKHAHGHSHDKKEGGEVAAAVEPIESEQPGTGATEIPEEVLMRFSENKFYNDLSKPEFEAGKVYRLKGADWIQRWLKRGGEIVTEELLEVEAEESVEAGAGDQTGDTPVVGGTENTENQPQQ